MMARVNNRASPAYVFAGSRKWTDPYPIRLLIAGLRAWSREHREAIRIVHGGANGADDLADKAADELGMDVVAYEPDWSLGRAGGPLRNQEILDSEAVKVAFVFANDISDSKGTADMVRRCMKEGIKVYQIVEIGEP